MDALGILPVSSFANKYYAFCSQFIGKEINKVLKTGEKRWAWKTWRTSSFNKYTLSKLLSEMDVQRSAFFKCLISLTSLGRLLKM